MNMNKTKLIVMLSCAFIFIINCNKEKISDKKNEIVYTKLKLNLTLPPDTSLSIGNDSFKHFIIINPLYKVDRIIWAENSGPIYTKGPDNFPCDTTSKTFTIGDQTFVAIHTCGIIANNNLSYDSLMDQLLSSGNWGYWGISFSMKNNDKNDFLIKYDSYKEDSTGTTPNAKRYKISIEGLYLNTIAVVNDTSNIIKEYSKEDTINSNSSFKNTAIIVDEKITNNEVNMNKEFYIGVKLIDSKSVKYGWILISLKLPKIILKEFAFKSVNKEPIIGGEKKSN